MRVDRDALGRDPNALIHERQPSAGRLWRVALPIVYENLLTLVVAWSDTILAGRLFGQGEHLAAVTVGSQIFFLITALAGLVSVGAGGMMSRRVGAGRTEKASEVLVQALLLAFFFGAGLTLFTVFLAPDLVQLLRLSPRAQPLAEQYLRVVALCFPLLLMQHASCACLRCTGHTWAALWVQVTCYVVTVGSSWSLAWGLVPGLQLGWLGIPTGTVIGYTVSASFALALLLRGYANLRIPFAVPTPDGRRFRQILQSGIPGGSIWVLINIGALWHLRIVGKLGDEAVAAQGIALRCEVLCWVMGRSLAAAAAALVGQSLGADRGDLARGYGWLSARFGLLTMTGIGVLIWLFSTPLIGLFLGHQEQRIAEQAAGLLPFVALIQPALAASLILTTGMVSGASDTRVPLGYILVCAIGLRVGMAYALTGGILDLGLIGAWLALVCDYYGRAAAATARFAQGGWMRYRY